MRKYNGESADLTPHFGPQITATDYEAETGLTEQAIVMLRHAADYLYDRTGGPDISPELFGDLEAIDLLDDIRCIDGEERLPTGGTHA